MTKKLPASIQDAVLNYSNFKTQRATKKCRAQAFRATREAGASPEVPLIDFT